MPSCMQRSSGNAEQRVKDQAPAKLSSSAEQLDPSQTRRRRFAPEKSR